MTWWGYGRPKGHWPQGKETNYFCVEICSISQGWNRKTINLWMYTTSIWGGIDKYDQMSSYYPLGRSGTNNMLYIVNMVRLGYCFTPYQRLWLYNGATLVAFYDTLGIRRTYSRLKPPASPRGLCTYLDTLSEVEQNPSTIKSYGQLQFLMVWCRPRKCLLLHFEFFVCLPSIFQLSGVLVNEIRHWHLSVVIVV